MTFLFAIHFSILSLLTLFLPLIGGPKEDNFDPGWTDSLMLLYHKLSGKEHLLLQALKNKDVATFKTLLTAQDIALYPQILVSALYSNWTDGLKAIIECTGAEVRPNGLAILFENLRKKYAQEKKELEPLIPTLIKTFGNDCLPTLEFLLTHGFSLEETDQEGNTPLMIAIANGHASLAHTLLEQPIDVQKPNQRGLTALHYAAFGGNESLMKALLEKKPNLLVQDVQGNSALHIATEKQHIHLIGLLLACWPDLVTLKNNNGDQAFHLLLKQKLTDSPSNPQVTFLNDIDLALLNSFGEHIDIYAENNQGLSLAKIMHDQAYWCTPTPEMNTGEQELTQEQEAERSAQCLLHESFSTRAQQLVNARHIRRKYAQLIALKMEGLNKEKNELSTAKSELEQKEMRIAQRSTELYATLAELEQEKQGIRQKKEKINAALQQHDTLTKASIGKLQTECAQKLHQFGV